MSDLEKSITEWREQMLAAGIKTPVPLDELENHLREEIERQMKSGLNEQTALEIAIQTIGQANTLKLEFGKNKNMNLQTYIWTKRERLAKWQAVHKQLLHDDAHYRKRFHSYLISVICLSLLLLAVYGYYFGVGLPGFAANLSVIICVSVTMIFLALRQFHFQNQRIRRYLELSHDV
jgi:hypothetical protein